MLARLIGFIGSCLLATILVSLFSTQFVLYDVSGYGITVDILTRVKSSVQDLLGLGPTLLMVITPAYLVGFLLAAGLSRLVLNQRSWGLVAGLTSIPTAIYILNTVLDVHVLSMTSRFTGWLALGLASLLGATLFYKNDFLPK